MIPPGPDHKRTEKSMGTEGITEAVREAGALRLDDITANAAQRIMRRVLKDDETPILDVAAFNSSI